MKYWSDAVHDGYVHSRRVRVLAGWLTSLIPQGARVLDVGCVKRTWDYLKRQMETVRLSAAAG